MREVTDSIEPLDRLFLVSSKSDTTIEPLSPSDYFRGLIEPMASKEIIGQDFVTITDSESPLVRLADETEFDPVYLNPAEIGGPYSVLSAFGLVPAAMIGINVKTPLARADSIREYCASYVPILENPCACLGACIGTLALRGCDKPTLIISPGISSFELWVELLIAKSTGKEGQGIIMIVGEPLMEPIPMLMTGYLSIRVCQEMTTPSQTQPLSGLSLPDSRW